MGSFQTLLEQVRSGSDQPALPHGREAIVGNDEVVVQLDPEQFCGTLDGARELDILGRGIEAATRMIVRQDKAASVYEDQ